MLDWRITSHHPSDTLGTCIRYCSADLYNTYTMYHPPDVRWHVLNDTMSQYYLCHHRIFGLNALQKPHLVRITSCFDIDPNPKYIITRTNNTTACTDTLRKEVSSVASTTYSTNHNRGHAIPEPINWRKKRGRTE